MKSADSTIMYNNPTVAELNKVSNFDPLKYLRQTANGMELPLKFQKLWFRLKYPQGRVRLSNIRITDQLAIIEARVFLDRKDTEAISSFTASCDVQSAPDGQYLKFAQELAIGQALNDAGFGIQFVSTSGGTVPESSVMTTPVQETKIEVKESALFVEQTETVHTTTEKTDQAVEKPVSQTVTINENDFEEIPTDFSFETDNASDPTIVEQSSPSVESFVEKSTPTNTEAAPSFTVIEKNSVIEGTSKEASAPAYTKDMSVKDICEVMSLEEAENYVVPSGACAGQKLSQVADRRPASLRFYINGYKGDDNILRAAATLITASRPELQAS